MQDLLDQSLQLSPMDEDTFKSLLSLQKTVTLSSLKEVNKTNNEKQDEDSTETISKLLPIINCQIKRAIAEELPNHTMHIMARI